MVWRIHFTAGDLSRIRVSPTLGPLAETVMALSLLRCPLQPRALFSEWRTQVQGKVTPQMKALMAMIPAGSKGVDLCALTGEAPTIGGGVQALLTVPREHLLAEMEFADRHRRLPAAAWAMADPGAREPLADATQAAYQALVQPYWARIHACLHAEQMARSRTLAYEGGDRLLASLQNQWIRWRPPVLEVLVPGQTEMHLAGRGIALVPSVFVGQHPSLHEHLNDVQAAPWLVLPVADAGIGDARLWGGPRSGGTRPGGTRPGGTRPRGTRPRGTALAALVGRNRAAVLGSIADGCTTTELAERAGISVAAASQHASVLRDAGLIVTRRQGGAVLHLLTPLGTELLEAG
jgi:DNA-binding transcriptional ArsR family regulator